MISIKFTDTDKSLSDFESQLYQIIEKDNVTKVSGNQFLGGEEINYILSAGGGIVLSKLASLLMDYLKRNQSKKVKVGDVEVQGFSKKDIEKILDKYLKDE